MTAIVFCWIISLILISSITRDPPQATRTFFLTFPITFCSAVGLCYLAGHLSSIRSMSRRYLLTIPIVLTALYFIIYYFASYYGRFPIYYARYWRTADRDVAVFAKENLNRYDRFIIDKNSGMNYTAILTYLKYPPAQFQKEVVWHNEDSEGFTYPEKFGKFEIREVDLSKDIQIPNALIVTSPKTKLENIGILRTITYPTRPVVINVGQDISRYPFTEPAFILIETHTN